MRVKALFLVSLFLLTAVSTVARAEPKQNFLLGGELGLESRHTHFATQYTATNPANSIQSFNSTRIVDAGTFMGLLGGWQIHCQRWLAGIEANVDFHSFEQHKPFLVSDALGTAGATASYNRGTTYGAYLRGGYWITPFFLGYLKAGAQFSRDELTFSVPGPGSDPTRTPFLSTNKEDIWGWLAGVGLEFPAFGPTSIRVEYNYVRTERMKFASPDITYKTKHTESHIGKIAWVWNFM